jgi:hypothetical protein
MTDQRQLKKLVRERMARTGESYSTARRHVIAKAPARTHHRPSALVGDMLRRAGHLDPRTGTPYSEAMVCGLGGGIGFMYAMFEYTNVPPLMTIVMQHHPEPWLPAVLDKLKIGYVEEHSTAPKQALAALRKWLAAGRAVYCDVDRGALPWQAGAMSISAEPYGVVVTGESDGVFQVLDRDTHPLPEPEFMAAWSGHRKGRHHRVTVEPATGPADLPAAVETAVGTTKAHLTGPVLGNSFDVNFGFSGMRRLADQLRDGRTKAGWERRLTDPGAFAWTVRRLHDCLEIEYTAPGGTRPLYADFLDETGNAAAAALFRESAGHWSALADRAAETSDAIGPLAELAERRMGVVMTRGRAGADEIRALSAEIAAEPEPDLDRPTLYAEFADLVDAARNAEERAVALLC